MPEIPDSPPFKLHSDFQPAGDQPTAIKQLVEGIHNGLTDQVLLGATGTGKTFTMAHVIQETQRPALILAPNKTLAAQLYGEMKTFFPENAVEYFVSYYDYYQPEAYVPRTDTFIEKESDINEQIDRMRHAATRALFERRDLIIVASVSCIYGIGSKEDYQAMTIEIKQGQRIDRQDLIKQLVALQYKRNDLAFERGAFRVRGDTVELFPVHFEDRAWRFSLFGDELEKITEFDPLTGEKFSDLPRVRIFANSHYITSGATITQAIIFIKRDLKVRLKELEAENKLLEAQRLEQRTRFDIEMLQATGMCQGIENYSRYLTGRDIGQAPPTLIEYLPEDALMFLDESHVMLPQIGGMYNGDRSRKTTLVEYGFRLPVALDNRPLKFEEWDALRPQTIYVSATPRATELERAGGVFAEQIVRPTGLIDPPVDVRPTQYQIDDLMTEAHAIIAKGGRIMVTTLTKKMAEDLTDYLNEHGLKVKYMHSDIETLERIEIIQELRAGVIDILVGINLLREGLDIPECMLMAILDADKEGFLRSKTSLIQTIGRAARNAESKVILYGDKITDSMRGAMDETDRRRAKQEAYNTKHGITPTTIKKSLTTGLEGIFDQRDRGQKVHALADQGQETFLMSPEQIKKRLKALDKQMHEAAGNLEFEEAAKLRDEIKRMQAQELGLK